MDKIPKNQSVTMIGGKNVAGISPQLKKPPKEETTEPESTETPTPNTPKEPIE